MIAFDIEEDTPASRCIATIAGKELVAVLAEVARQHPPVADRYRDLVAALLEARAIEAGPSGEFHQMNEPAAPPDDGVEDWAA